MSAKAGIVNPPIKKRNRQELFSTFCRLYSFLTYEEKMKIALGMTALSVNAITNLSFPYILGQVNIEAANLDILQSCILIGVGSQ
jgi:hypothetical protein